jgi:hypothetical protein
MRRSLQLSPLAAAVVFCLFASRKAHFVTRPDKMLSVRSLSFNFLTVLSFGTFWSASAYQQACDSSQCLVEHCVVSGVDANPSGNRTGDETEQDILYPCAEGYEGRVWTDEDKVTVMVNSSMAYQSFYTCCVEGYTNIPVAVLETCSADACTSPDGMGGQDCSADGFIHPLVCDQDSDYKHATKESGGTIYSPYICCTEAADQSNRVMFVLASLWSALCGITFIACSILIVAILSSKKARAQGYNIYLVFLALTDALFNLFSFARNIVNISGQQLSNPLGGTVHALEWFHTAANMWLNAFIVYSIHCMLVKAQKFVRTPPPTIKQVLYQVSIIYFFAALWAAWSLVLLFQGSNIFSNTNAAWLTSKSLMCGPPFLYTVAACTHVWWKQLLPRQGRTRILSLYFLRVVLVFLLTWVPFLILVDVTYYKTASLWMLGLAYFFASFQGLLSVVVAMGKPDVKRAVLNLLCCRADEFNATEERFLGSAAERLGRSFLFLRSSINSFVDRGPKESAAFSHSSVEGRNSTSLFDSKYASGLEGGTSTSFFESKHVSMGPPIDEISEHEPSHAELVDNHSMAVSESASCGDDRDEDKEEPVVAAAPDTANEDLEKQINP